MKFCKDCIYFNRETSPQTCMHPVMLNLVTGEPNWCATNRAGRCGFDGAHFEALEEE